MRLYGGRKIKILKVYEQIVQYKRIADKLSAVENDYFR